MITSSARPAIAAGRNWTEWGWRRLDERARAAVASCHDDGAARARIVPFARRVMRTYSSNFYVVTRFLSAAKRGDVEVLYANVRYPDEVVDTFPLTSEERDSRLCEWSTQYEEALCQPSIRCALDAGVPVFLAALAEQTRRRGIPPDHYRAFMQAMRMDVRPRAFTSLSDLVDSYVYGSAVVVGYLLVYAFGPSAPGEMPRALSSARSLGIGLQLTNFARDAGEDLARGRVYVPADMLEDEGLREVDPASPENRAALGRAARRLAEVARDYYAAARSDIDAFAPDSRTAIRACMDTFALLNDHVIRSPHGIEVRESLSLRRKLAPLPLSKYWRIPAAYLTEWRT